MNQYTKSSRRQAALGFAAAILVAATVSAAAQQKAPAGKPAWIMPNILAAARAEGSVTVFGSINQQEALPLWKIFQDETGIKVNYVRGSDSQLTARIEIEARAHKDSWDLLMTTGTTRLPVQLRAQFDPPQAKGLMPEGRSSDHRWYGVYGDYNTPSYNSKFIKASELPKTYEDFLKHPEWAGHVGIDAEDYPWLAGLLQYYGKDKGQALVKKLIKTLKPIPVDGHLALARGVGSGEYWVALNNFINLTINQKLSGAPTDYWGVNPVTLILGQVAMDAHAPHPKAALLAANFLLSQQGQQELVKHGRLPVRLGVSPNPPDAITKLGSHKVIVLNITPQDERNWSQEFKSLFHE